MIEFEHASEAALTPSNEELLKHSPLLPPYCYVRTLDMSKQAEIDKAYKDKLWAKLGLKPQARSDRKVHVHDEDASRPVNSYERTLVSIGQMLTKIPGECIVYRPDSSLPEEEQYCLRLLSVGVV